MKVIVDSVLYDSISSNIIIGITEEEKKELCKTPNSEVAVYKAKAMDKVADPILEEDIENMKLQMGLTHERF